MKLKRISFVLLLIFIPISLALAQVPKQKILLNNVNNPKTEIKVLSESESEITIKFSIDDFYAERLETTNGVFTKLTFKDGKSATELGKPQLPVFRKIIELSYDANPTVEIISSTVEELNITEKGMTKIYPWQHPISKTPEYKPFEFDEEIYKTDKYYPDNIFDITDLGLLRKHNLYQITVFPIQYNPVQAKLRVYNNVTFKVCFNTDKSPSTQFEIEKYQSDLFDKMVKSISFNNEFPKSMVLMKTTTELPSTFLIICHDDFYNPISSFATHKENLGFDVTVVKKSDLADQTANGIRNYIINAYSNWDPPVENVLLVGDVAYIPTFTGDYCGTASDLKYSLMDGDWLPDVFVGRFSVETTTQLSNIINKQIDYETEDWGTLDWTKKAVFMASNDNYTISEGTHNYVIEFYLEPEGYTIDKLYSYTYSATTTQVINSFNDGRIYGVYSGHGNETSWADGPALSQNQVRNLTNSYKLPLVFSFACLTGKFNYVNECFGETWLRESNKAAVGFWGSSDYTYWDPDDVLQRGLFSAIYDDLKTSFGKMTVEAKIKFLDDYPISTSTAKEYFEKYNILGDPSLNYAHGVSGTISQNTTWGGTIIIIGNISVSSGVTLTISNSTNITLNGYSIISTGGTITVESGVTINSSNSHTRLITGSAIKGIYSTIASAMSAATSGQSIEIYGAHTLAANLTVPSGVTLTFKNGSDITLDSHTIQKGSGALAIESGATFTPNIRLMSGSTVLGLYLSLDAAYADGTEVEVRGGTYTFNNTYVLLNGRSLKVKEGSVFEFPSGKYLDVRPTSTFEADHATFTSISGIWTGIVYRTSSNGYINECNISNATRAILDNSGTPDLVFTGNTITNSTHGIYCGYSGSPEIRNNTLSNISNYAIYCSGSDTSMVIADNIISNSTYGLYFYNANPQISSNKLTHSKVYFNNSNSELTNNLITVSGGNEAFYMYASSPTLFYNTISSTEAWLTIRAFNGSDPVFGDWGLSGYNYLSADMDADGVIWASNGSHPVLGWNVAGDCETGPYVGGNNSIIGYMVPAAALDGTSGISAQYCWWGQTPAPYCYGDVNTNCPLPSDPGSGSTLSKSVTLPVMASHPEEEPGDEEAKTLWEVAMRAVSEKNYTAALDDFQSLIRLYPASTYAYRALSMSVRLCREQKTGDMLTYLDELLTGVEDQTLRAVIKSRKVSEYRRMKDIEQAITLSREILAENPETIHETTALFDLFNLCQKDLADSVQAEYYVTELKTKYPEDELTGIARIDWGEDPEKVVIQKRTLPGQEEEILPETFTLGSAYPNPFNPVTRLTYSLPDAGDLVFEIVDITGRIVDRITFTNHPAGEHHFDYTGSHLSTGLYIIRARYDRQVQIRKIVYMK